MKECVIFSLTDNKTLLNKLADKLGCTPGSLETRKFPDGEYYVCVHTDVKNKTALLVCGLEHPNNKILPLYFAAKTIKELGADKICLVAPYLSYMRQDKRFKTGEAVTSILFAKFLSSFIDILITIDPHLHRIHHLSDIYCIDSVKTLHATKNIAEWILTNIPSPFIVGPDEESNQWISEIANRIHAPYLTAKKIRHNDREIEMLLPEINSQNKVPVIVDDIISTGTSMIVLLQQLAARGIKESVCIAVHALFEENTCTNLLNAGAKEVITCNTIQHPSNKIDISDILIEAINELNF